MLRWKTAFVQNFNEFSGWSGGLVKINFSNAAEHPKTCLFGWIGVTFYTDGHLELNYGGGKETEKKPCLWHCTVWTPQRAGSHYSQGLGHASTKKKKKKKPSRAFKATSLTSLRLGACGWAGAAPLITGLAPDGAQRLLRGVCVRPAAARWALTPHARCKM